MENKINLGKKLFYIYVLSIYLFYLTKKIKIKLTK